MAGPPASAAPPAAAGAAGAATAARGSPRSRRRSPARPGHVTRPGLVTQHGPGRFAFGQLLLPQPPGPRALSAVPGTASCSGAPPSLARELCAPLHGRCRRPPAGLPPGRPRPLLVAVPTGLSSPRKK